MSLQTIVFYLSLVRMLVSKKDNLKRLFAPRSVAIIGFSLNPKKLGHLIYKNLVSSGYKGPIFLVNIKGGEFKGQPIYKSLLEVPVHIDLAIVVIPASFVPQVVLEAKKSEVSSLIVISAGFKEIGSQGQNREEEIKKILKNSASRLLGVNCLGLVSYNQPLSPLNATFLADMPLNGDIAFMSQSGAFGSAAVDWSLSRKLGFRYFASLGNKTDINELDLLEFFGQDKQVGVIAAYLESIDRGYEFVKLAAKISQQKPIVVLTPGTSARAKKAAISHTGSLVNDSQVVKVALKKAGIIQVSTIEEMFTYLLLFSLIKNRQVGQATAIVTNAGGPAIVVSDLLDRYGFTVPELELKTETYLRKVLPPEANVTDPIDVVGDADAERYKLALDAVATDRNVDNIIVLLTPQITTETKKTADYILKISQKSQKVIIASFIGGKRVAKGYQYLSEKGVPVFYFPDNALKALKAIYDYQHPIKIEKRLDWPKISSSKPVERIKTYLRELSCSRSQFDSYWFWQLLKALGLPLVKSRFLPLERFKELNNFNQQLFEKEAELISQKFSFPLVVKLTGEKINHKTDLGLVKLAIKNKEELTAAFLDLIKRGQELALIEKRNYLLVQEEISRDWELIVGLKYDPSFGYVLMIGAGGLGAELYQDVQSLLLPASEEEIKLAFSRTKIFQMLSGYRHSYVYDLGKVITLFTQISYLPKHLPSLASADFNPAIVNKNGIFIVDAKAFNQ